MIRGRTLLLGILLSAVGWQLWFGETFSGMSAAGLAGITLGLGAVAASLPSSVGLARRAAAILFVLAIQFLTAHTLELQLALWKDLPGGAELLSAMAHAFGLDSAPRGGNLVVHDGNLLLEYRPSLTRMSAFILVMMLAGLAGTAVAVPLARARAVLLRWGALLCGYALLRTLGLLLARADLPVQGVEVGPWFTLLSWLPALVLAPSSIELKAQPLGTPFATASAAMALGLCWTLAISWEDPGRPKQGRVMVDDSHGDWERTDLPFDTKEFGRRAAYSYGNLYDLLGWHYDVRRWTREQGPITPAALDGVDVLVLKTPTTAFQPQEVDAIEAFVHRGGGLFMIGDHTDLFGMTTYLNEVSSRFGLRLRSDDTFDLVTGSTTRWTAPRWGAHPIARLVKEFEFETSATIVASAGIQAPIIGTALGSEEADYNNPGFFGNIKLDPSDGLGFFLQFATRHVGPGRVALSSDSTPFSNFSLFFPGRRELVLATVQYLNRESTPLRLVSWLATLGALLALSASFWLRGGMAAAGGILAGVSLGTAVTTLAASSLTLPTPKAQIPTVVFDLDISKAPFPPGLITDAQYDMHGFDTLVVATQRLGLMPVFSHDLRQSLQTASVVVLVHPSRRLSTQEQEELVRYVSRGGRLLVMDGLLEPGSETNSVLAPFGLSVVRQPVRPTAERVTPDAEGKVYRFTRPIHSVAGGFPVLMDEEGRALYAEADIGQGRVGVLAESATVGRGALGNRFYDSPNAEQQESYNTVFLIFRQLLEKRP
ncbi:MAG: hypothetical protein JXB05_03720 [Myxococcaceae bacterium]|nr:hypothetical protein [Myxococcaceae bacterium]